MLQTNLQDNQVEILEKSANAFFEKGGRRGIVGEVRSYNGREYQKTSIGWRVRAQGHSHIASNNNTPTTHTASQLPHNNISQNNTQVVPTKATVSSDDSQTHSKAEGSSKSDAIARLASSVINGSSKSLIIYGEGSNDEKNQAISKELQNKKGYTSEGNDYDYVKMHSSGAKDLFDAAYNHNGKILIYSNGDAALKNEATASLISNIVGGKELSLGDQTENQNDRIPKFFKFTGKLIITSSLRREAVPSAIKAHSVSIDTTDRNQDSSNSQP